MISLIITIVHVLGCLALIMIVLLQTGKGADIGAVFGAGSSQTVFGSQGGGSVMGKITTAVAIIFMLTSLGLNVFTGPRLSKSIMDEVATPATQSQPVAPAESSPMSDSNPQ